MKKLLFCIVFTLIMSSCASINNNDSTVLYHEYSQYENGTNKNNIIKVAENYFSPDLLGKFYETNPDAIGLLLFKNYMANQDSHFEKINDQKGCLTINGYDKDHDPLLFSLEYVLNDGRWLINKFHVVFVESKQDLSTSAKCPNEFGVH